MLTSGSGLDHDTFVFSVGFEGSSGNDRITDFDAGEDVISLRNSGFTSLDDVLDNADESWGNTVINLGNGNTLTLEGVAVSELTAQDFTFV